MIDFKNHDTLLPWCFWNKTDVGYDSFHVSATLQLSQSSCVCKDLHVFYWYLPLMERHTNWLRHVLNLLRSENHWLSCLQNMGLGVGSSLMTTSSSEDKEFRQLIMNTSRTLSVHGYNVLTGVLNVIGNIKLLMYLSICVASHKHVQLFLLTSLLPERNAKILYAYRTRYPSLSMPYWPYFSAVVVRSQKMIYLSVFPSAVSLEHCSCEAQVHEKNCQVIVESHPTSHKHCLEQIKSVNSTTFLGLICLISLPTSYDYQLNWQLAIIMFIQFIYIGVGNPATAGTRTDGTTRLN